jgi:hypothetical protein
VRGNEILFRSECCRAIIRTDRAFLFPSRWGFMKGWAGTVQLAHIILCDVHGAWQRLPPKP